MDHSNDLHVGQVRRMPERIPMVDEMEEETEEELEEEWRLLKAMFSYKLKKAGVRSPWLTVGSSHPRHSPNLSLLVTLSHSAIPSFSTVWMTLTSLMWKRRKRKRRRGRRRNR